MLSCRAYEKFFTLRSSLFTYFLHTRHLRHAWHTLHTAHHLRHLVASHHLHHLACLFKLLDELVYLLDIGTRTLGNTLAARCV